MKPKPFPLLFASASMLLSAFFAPALPDFSRRPLGAEEVKKETKKSHAPPPPSAAGKKPNALKGFPPSPAPPGAAAGRAAAAPEESAAGSQPGGEGFLRRMALFIRAYWTWIILCLIAALAATVWTLFGRRGKAATAENPFAELGLGEPNPSKGSSTAGAGSKRFSSTKIQASDVNKRLSGPVKTTEVETDREYALVVDEEDLKMPPLPEGAEEAAGREHGDSSRIRKLLDDKNYNEAYEEYARQIEANAALEFQTETEEALSEHLIRAHELEKAARVLEHHVATHSKKEIRPEAYFNLGYIHFMHRTLNKSRRFLKLFVDTEKNPEYIARAKKILKKLEKSGNLN
jgi:hypothetical protein